MWRDKNGKEAQVRGCFVKNYQIRNYVLHCDRECDTIERMSRPRKDAHEPTGKIPSADADGKKMPSGSKGRVLTDLKRYSDNPDAPMVSHGVASNALAETRNMNLSPSKMYEDNGHKMNAVAALAARSEVAKMPRTKHDLMVSLGDFFQFCGENKLPPTIGGFAVWNGVSVQRVNQIERDKSNAEMSEAIAVCKDCIRNFLELCAMDSTLNPIIYFHQNKVYYGAVENQGILVRTEDNQSDLTDDEYRERVIMLTQDEDGVYRP